MSVKNILVLLIMSLMLMASKHEFYVSVGTMVVSEDGKNIQFSAKYFTDDLEDALMQAFKLEQRSEALNESHIKAYLLRNIECKVQGKIWPMKYVGFENEEDVTWVYLEYQKPNPNEKLYMKNSMLFNVRPKQVNIIHIKTKTTSTLSFNRRNSENTFSL